MKKAILLRHYPSRDEIYIQEDEIVQSLLARMGTGGNQVPLILEKESMKSIVNIENHPCTGYMRERTDDVVGALRERLGTGGGEGPIIMEKDDRDTEYVVRKLMPQECMALQGFPPDWCDIPDTVVNGKKVKASDSAKYRAAGNSVALPQWWWLAERLKPYLPEDAKMASLFDGIGGFPLVFNEAYGDGCAVWASEIEPFPIAVTMNRFGDDYGE